MIHYLIAVVAVFLLTAGWTMVDRMAQAHGTTSYDGCERPERLGGCSHCDISSTCGVSHDSNSQG